MGLLDQAVDTLKSAAQALTGVSTQQSKSIYEEANDLKVIENGTGGYPWDIDGNDWHKVFAYQFVVSEGAQQVSPQAAIASGADIINFENGLTDEGGEFLYTLPIPPQSLNTRMIPASQVTPTFGGVVEETGSNVFWLITMSGTTGIAVSRTSNGQTGYISRDQMAQQFRDKIATTGLLSGPLAGLGSALSKIGGIADTAIGAANAFSSGDISGGIGGVVGAINEALLPPLPYGGSAVNQKTNGYTEIQELHRFLYTYSRLKASNADRFRLKFRNYKTGQEWDCVLQDFQIQQSAQNPMLYRYTISLKCWNLRPVNKAEKDAAVYDRFGPHGDLKAVNTVGLAQMGKLAAAMWNTTNGNTTSPEFLLNK
jgi:hypothetical protein